MFVIAPNAILTVDHHPDIFIRDYGANSERYLLLNQALPRDTELSLEPIDLGSTFVNGYSLHRTVDADSSYVVGHCFEIRRGIALVMPAALIIRSTRLASGRARVLETARMKISDSVTIFKTGNLGLFIGVSDETFVL